MTTFVFEQQWDASQLTVEDRGLSRYYRADQVVSEEEETGLFVEIHSWDNTKVHKCFRNLEGKKLRITVESIE